jgi:UDP-N-acetylmuramate: L-alanyl-gamma-D-glutamyl-meso-diaminopimelate ligase
MKFYFMGICGTAMGNAALLLKSQGHEVVGSDSGVYPPMSTVLENAGIRLLEGFSEENLTSARPDVVVVGNAISRGNPEMEWLLDTREHPFVSLPRLIAERVMKKRRVVGVAGTHGKTTTTTLVATLLRTGGHDAGWLIGGVPMSLPGGAHLGSESEPFVIEGDEYDSAFFDKRSKFIHYLPHVLVLNNLEFDHGDIFRDLQDIKRSFTHLLRTVPRNGTVLMNGDDENLMSLLPVPWTQIRKVGLSGSCDLRIQDFTEDPEGSHFDLVHQGKLWGHIDWKMCGLYNARNAAMAVYATTLARKLEAPDQSMLDALAAFGGVKRRQEVLADAGNLRIIEDFAHHPTAISGTLESFRNRFPEKHLVACFEPRSNTATTNIFQTEFTQSLSKADSVYLGAIHRAEKIEPDKRLDTEAMVKTLGDMGRDAAAFQKNVDLLDHLRNKFGTDPLDQPTLVCFFSNGGFDAVPATFSGEWMAANPA